MSTRALPPAFLILDQSFDPLAVGGPLNVCPAAVLEDQHGVERGLRIAAMVVIGLPSFNGFESLQPMLEPPS